VGHFRFIEFTSKEHPVKKYTVIPQLTGSFFGDTEDNFCLFHVDAVDPKQAVYKAQQEKITEAEIGLATAII
jgi:hypothetical protein